MQKNLPRLTPSEFEIMSVIWNNGEMTVTDIMNAVNEKSVKQFARSTIQVQVQRLEEKGWLNHRIESKKFLIFANVPRGTASKSIVKDVKQRIFNGKCSELIKSLFGNNIKISSDEIKKIRSIIDKYEENSNE